MALDLWQQLKTKLNRPLFVLAPMINVTDAAFRQIIAAHGKPDAFFTEFTSVDGLCSPGRTNLLVNLQYAEQERPVILQVFGSKPENFYNVAKLAQEMKFDGIDINTGCPDKAVIKQHAGASLIRDPKLAQEIIHATKEGAGDIPVSVKTRLGFSEDSTEEWIPALLETKPAVITIHARTKKEMSDVPARWESINRAVEIRNQMKSNTLILGNGDVLNLEDGHAKVEASGADGAMLGRAIFGNPWAFNPDVKKSQLSYEEILRVMCEHAQLFEKMYGVDARPPFSRKNFLIMRKHFGAYVSGFPRSKKLRAQLMETNNAQEVRAAADWYIGTVLPEFADSPEMTSAHPQTWKPNYEGKNM